MPDYTATFQRIAAPFDDAILKTTLTALHDLRIGFFPADLWLSATDRAVLNEPADYSRQLIPEGYYIQPGVATLPLDCSNGVHVVFTETGNPATLPASVVLKMPDQTIDRNGWTIDTLLDLFKAVITAFNPDYGYLYDNSHAVRPDYTSRMFEYQGRRVPRGLFWINYYGPEWARNVGLARLDRLRSAVPVFEWLEHGGVLFGIQEEPYDESIAAHSERQKRLEELVELRQLQAAFPNRGGDSRSVS